MLDLFLGTLEALLNIEEIKNELKENSLKYVLLDAIEEFNKYDE